MLAEIGAGISSLKSLYDNFKALKEANDAKVRDAVISEMQGKIIALQASQMVVAAKYDEVESELLRYKNWEATAVRYDLQDLGGKTYAYVLKKGDLEAHHLLCPSCFQRREKGILQFQFKSYNSQDVYKCSICKDELALGTRLEPRDSGNRGGSGWTG